MHGAVVLFGFTAILGKMITLSSYMIVWWRVFFTVISMLLVFIFFKRSTSVSLLSYLKFIGVGVLISVHWLCFFGSVKLGSASLTLICMSSAGFFASMIEPLYFKRPISKLDIVIAACLIPAMYFVVNTVSGYNVNAVIIAIISALLAAIFSVLNKKLVESTDALLLTFYELIGVLIVLSLGFPILKMLVPDIIFIPQKGDWIPIIVLAILCTTVAWVISLMALRHLTAFESALIINLEPVYGILLASIMLKEYEQLNTRFYLGSALIILILLSYPILKRKFDVERSH